MKPSARTIAVLLLLASSLLPLASCNDFERNAYRALKLAKVEYELLQDHAARAYVNGRLTDDQWNRFAVAGHRFIAAHTLAADLMKTYQQARRAGATADETQRLQAQINAALAQLPVLLADLRNLLASFDSPAPSSLIVIPSEAPTPVGAQSRDPLFSGPVGQTFLSAISVGGAFSERSEDPVEDPERSLPQAGESRRERRPPPVAGVEGPRPRPMNPHASTVIPSGVPTQSGRSRGICFSTPSQRSPLEVSSGAHDFSKRGNSRAKIPSEAEGSRAENSAAHSASTDGVPGNPFRVSPVSNSLLTTNGGVQWP